MKRIIAGIILGILSCTVHVGIAFVNPPLEVVKMVVADYFDLHNNQTGKTPFKPDDLNRKYEIFELRTKQNVENSIKNGEIYFCAIFGDDLCGVYLLLENDTPKLMRVEDIGDYKIIWDFMYRNGYTLKQVNTCVEFITSNYDYEKSIAVH